MPTKVTDGSSIIVYDRSLLFWVVHNRLERSDQGPGQGPVQGSVEELEDELALEAEGARE